MKVFSANLNIFLLVGASRNFTEINFVKYSHWYFLTILKFRFHIFRVYDMSHLRSVSKYSIHHFLEGRDDGGDNFSRHNLSPHKHREIDSGQITVVKKFNLHKPPLMNYIFYTPVLVLAIPLHTQRPIPSHPIPLIGLGVLNNFVVIWIK